MSLRHLIYWVKNIPWQIFYQELRSIVGQPILIILNGLVLAITGAIFASELSLHASQPGQLPLNLQNVLSVYTFLLLFVMPALTRRPLTNPQNNNWVQRKVIVGFLFFLLTTLLTGIFPIILYRLGNPALRVIFTAYFGVILYGATLLSIGILLSSLVKNRKLAYGLTVGVTLFLYLLIVPTRLFSLGATAVSILNELSLSGRQERFFQGLIVLKDVMYFLLLTIVSLTAATAIVERRSKSYILSITALAFLIYALTAPLPLPSKTAYFITGHGERDIQNIEADGLETAVTLLQEIGFNSQPLNLAESGEVPADANILFLIDQQAPLAPEEIALLDSYLNSGGALFIARDAIDTEGRLAAEADDLLPWLQTAWGITLRPDIIIDTSLAQAEQAIGLTFLGAEYGNSSITSGLDPFSTLFHAARSLAVTKIENVTAVHLITTSDLAWGETNIEQMSSAGEVAPDVEDAQGKLTVAVSAENSFSGARLVLFGDTDFVSNSLITQGSNGRLWQNTVSWLDGEDDATLGLIGINDVPRQVTISQSQLPWLQAISITLPATLLGFIGFGVWYLERKRP